MCAYICTGMGRFVSTRTGEITGKFGEDTADGDQLAFTLLAVDAGGQTAVVEEYTFELADPPTFSVTTADQRTAVGGDFDDYDQLQQLVRTQMKTVRQSQMNFHGKK